MERYLQKSLKKNNFFDYKIIRKEYGVIPMGFLKKKKNLLIKIIITSLEVVWEEQ